MPKPQATVGEGCRWQDFFAIMGLFLLRLSQARDMADVNTAAGVTEEELSEFLDWAQPAQEAA